MTSPRGFTREGFSSVQAEVQRPGGEEGPAIGIISSKAANASHRSQGAEHR